MDEYKILADVYDILNPKEEIFDQRPFFEKLVKDYSVETCLDVACGTGWHLVMFHDMGLISVGSDISADMLALAKVNTQGTDVVLQQSDYRQLASAWADTFDMVTCLTTSLPHMLTDEDIVRALRSMYDRLNDDGILVISNGITDSFLDTKPKFIPARVLSQDAFYFIAEYPTDEVFSFNILYIKKTDESFEHKFTTVDYSAMRQETLERCFGQTKFKTISYYGDYNFSPYSREMSSKLIVVAQK